MLILNFAFSLFFALKPFFVRIHLNHTSKKNGMYLLIIKNKTIYQVLYSLTIFMYVLLYRTNVLFDYLIFRQYEVIKNDEKKDGCITDTTPCNDY